MMHWLNVPINNPASVEGIKGKLFVEVFVFHEDKLLLVHGAPTNVWGFPCEGQIPLANGITEFMSGLYEQSTSQPTALDSLQHLALSGLAAGLQDGVLENLQFHDLVFEDALIVHGQTEDPRQVPTASLVLVTSISDLHLDKIRRGKDNCFSLQGCSGVCDDIRLCNLDQVADLLSEPGDRLLATQATERYKVASKKEFVLRHKDPGLQAWVENVLITFILCQVVSRGQKLWDELRKSQRNHPFEHVMRNYAMVLSSKMMAAMGQEELTIWPVAVEQARTFSLMDGVDVGTYAWKNCAMRIEWMDVGMKPEWITDDGRLRINWNE